MKDWIELTTAAGKKILLRKSAVIEVLEETDDNRGKYSSETKTLINTSGQITIVKEGYELIRQQLI